MTLNTRYAAVDKTAIQHKISINFSLFSVFILFSVFNLLFFAPIFGACFLVLCRCFLLYPPEVPNFSFSYFSFHIHFNLIVVFSVCFLPLFSAHCFLRLFFCTPFLIVFSVFFFDLFFAASFF